MQSPGNRALFIALFFLCLGILRLSGETIPLIGPPVEARTVFPFSVEKVIHPVVGQLPSPDFVEEIRRNQVSLVTGIPAEMLKWSIRNRLQTLPVPVGLREPSRGCPSNLHRRMLPMDLVQL